MTPSARLSAAIEVLDRILSGANPEQVLTSWGRANRFAGSGDRQAIRDLVYDGLRRKRSAAAMGGAMSGRGLILGLCRQDGADIAALFTGLGHAPAPPGPEEQGCEPLPGPEAMDCQDWLFPHLKQSLGDDCESNLLALRQRAPVFLRVNLARIDAKGALAALAADGISAAPFALSPSALIVTGQARKIATSAAYQTGLVELQDAASQAVADLLPLHAGQKVLDLCAGGGGKSLAMAARQPALRLFAHDSAPQRLVDLTRRAVRGGHSITLTAKPEAEAPFDLILTDVPCSGSGSWRRDPQGKWALTPQRLTDLRATQAAILDRAARMLAPGGVLAYATCSVLREENEDQIADFLAKNQGFDLGAQQRLGLGQGADGFFCALLHQRGR